MKSAVLVAGGVALFAIADVFASFLSWHGAPTDTTWQPSFWRYELLRLSGWLVLALIAAALSFAAAYVFSRYPRSLQRHLPTATPTAAVLFCISAFAAEYTASIRFWQRIPQNDAEALWFSERSYVREHLQAWFVVVAVISAIGFYWRWRHARKARLGAGC